MLYPVKKSKIQDNRLIVIVMSIILVVFGIIIYLIINRNTEGTSINLVETTANEIIANRDSVNWDKYKKEDIELSEKNTIIKYGGIYNISGSIDDGSIVINSSDNVKLILNNVTINNSSGPAIYVEDVDNLTIELVGTNKINVTTNEELNGAIYSKDDIVLNGEGSLVIKSNYDGIVSKNNLIITDGNYIVEASDDGIRGKDNVIISNGSFKITALGDAIKTTNEQEADKGNIIIDEGNFEISSTKDGFQAINNIIVNGGTYKIKTGNGSSKADLRMDYGFRNNTKTNTESAKGFKSDREVLIKNGTMEIDSEDDAIHSNGIVVIKDSDLVISAGDDGVHADEDLKIEKTKVDIETSYEGLEAYNITLSGSDIKVKASDDGINVCDPKSEDNEEIEQNDRMNNKGMFNDTKGLLTIEDTTLYVNSEGDGLDSNGSIKMTSGTVYVDGPQSGGNSAIDYNGEFNITGGTLIAVGYADMVENVSDSSTQTTVLLFLNGTFEGEFSFGDITYKPEKKYQSIIISSSDLKVGETYTLKIGDKSSDITIDSLISTIGNSSANRGEPGNRNNGHRPGENNRNK